MKFAVCTAAHGPHGALLEVTGPALERYAQRHRASLVVLDHRLAPERPAAWDKILLLRDLIGEHDVVCWVDADAFVLDTAPAIAAELTSMHFLGVVEHTMRGMRVPNTGVMVVSSGRRAARFLDAVWSRTDYVHHRWWENAALLATLGYRLGPHVGPARPSRWRAGVRFLDKSWNSIPDDPAEHPFVAHFPGLPLDERLALLRRVAREGCLDSAPGWAFDASVRK